MTETPDAPIVRYRVEVAPRTIFFIGCVVAAVWLLGQLMTVISVVTVALVLVGTVAPVVSWLERRGVRRGRALVVVFMAATLALVGVMLLMVPPLIAELLNLIEGAPKARAHVVHALQGYSWAGPLRTALEDLPLDHLAVNTGKIMLGYSGKLFEAIGYGISTLFIAIYLLADPAGAKGMVYSVVPRRHHVKLARILLELKVIVGGYVRGQLITSLSISVFVFVLLTVLGVPNALALALFAGFTDVIPFVGGYIASTPVVIAVAPHGTVTTIVVAVLMILYQEFESRILVPRVYGRVLRLHAAIVVVALLVGATLGGVLGALLALPIAAAVRMVIRELRVDLPGVAPNPEELLNRDDTAAEVYANLSEGSTVAESVVIADEVATTIKKNEALDNEAPTTIPRPALSKP